jgi:ankyrin repeat protein
MKTLFSTSSFLENNDLNLYNAIKIGNENEVIKLIERYPFLLNKFIFGFTPIMIASSYGELSILNYLIDNDANINLQNESDNWTALYVSLINGNINCACALIKFGCDISLLSSVSNINFMLI